MEEYSDTIFVSLKPEEGNRTNRFLFLAVMDMHSKYLWTRKIEEVTTHNVINAFSYLFRTSMPLFPIIRVDRDVVLNSLKTTYFAKKGILLRARRSVYHMGGFEGVIKTVKRKLIQHMPKNGGDKIWSQKRLEMALADCTTSYNESVSSSHNLIPSRVNSSKFDALLRLKLYGPQAKLEPFEKFHTKQMERRKKFNTPEKVSDRRDISESADSFKKGAVVFIDFEPKKAGSRAYDVRRMRYYVISKVDTFASPFLQDINSGVNLKGTYYGKELSYADLSKLEPERVLKRKKINGKKFIYTTFKGYDSSFARWIPEQ